MLNIEVIFFNWIISNIIITNKNNIVIAPTYIIITTKPMKSKFKDIKNPELYKNTKTNQNIEWTGFVEVIVIITDANNKKVNKKKQLFHAE